MKTNRHGKDDKRLLIATKSAIFLCSQIKIIRSYKVTRQMAWVDLKKFEYEEPNKIILNFRTEKLNLTFDDAKKFAEEIIPSLFMLFGNNLPFKLLVDSLSINRPEKTDKFLLSHIFLSFCHSLNLPENEGIINSLNNIQNQEFIDINLTQLKFDQKYMPALLSTLEYGFNIRSFSANCELIPNFFNFLSTIFNNNSHSISSISIFNCTNFDNFEQFCEAVVHSNLRSLSFMKSKIPPKAFEKLVCEIIPESGITSIKFASCPFQKNYVDLICSNADNFSKISAIAINNSDFIKEAEPFNNFFNFIRKINNLSSLELINDMFDISDVFNALDQADINLTSINLSKNSCSAKFTGQYLLPVPLKEVKVRNVRWSVTALAYILTRQKYINLIDLDISSQKPFNVDEMMQCDDEALVRMQSHLKPGSNKNISALIWNNNFLSTGFFTFLLGMENLQKLSIDCYEIEDNKTSVEILNSFVLYLQNSKLKELSIRGNSNSPSNSPSTSNSPFHSPSKELIKGLFAVIGAHQTLNILDVSDNDIGDNGLELLVDCISRNKNLVRISFDGSKLQSPQKFIECCRKLSENDHIQFIAKPKNDIEELTKKEDLLKLKPGAVEQAWTSLQEKIERNHKNEISLNSQPQNENEINDSMLLSQMTTHEASWDIEIKVPFNKESNLWDSLRDKYSLYSLTGIPPDSDDEHDALIYL
ncbi:hypothetical protein TRFO_04917 [Tritrichomonas foetus]|uniref:Leucine Rich Repeat family protein n=1 Tax=Tritrichomonas foetus TaxID=1144522 RepID=A0A1J4KBM3_9EUKA|nr:hypothetical protein TRFO_04917 [Tritrichomonas foetus]|eukprot:OHT08304.1 hypothetical protein TRFO_04917 [Tritrichomonas foetus]